MKKVVSLVAALVLSFALFGCALADVNEDLDNLATAVMMATANDGGQLHCIACYHRDYDVFSLRMWADGVDLDTWYDLSISDQEILISVIEAMQSWVWESVQGISADTDVLVSFASDDCKLIKLWLNGVDWTEVIA